MSVTRRLLILPCILSVCAAIAQGDADTMPVDTLKGFSIEAKPAFVYASWQRNPFSKSAITSQDIERLAEPTIEPLLNSVPGLWMQTGALNTNRISMRGVGYREPFATTGIKIYLDEIPLTNGVGEASIEDIHPWILSGIDVWRGPASALWGSGLGGMIHLRSKVTEENYARVRMQAGSFGRWQTDANLSFGYGDLDQHSTRLHYQYLTDGGYRENNDYGKHSFTWSQRWSPKETFSISSFLHGIRLKAFIPSSLNQDDYISRPSIAAPSWLAVRGNEDYHKWIAGLTALWTISPHLVYQGALFGTFFNSDEVRPFNVLEEGNASYGIRQRLTFRMGSSGVMHAGLETFHEHYEASTFETLTGGAKGNRLSTLDEDRTYFNGFLQAEFDIKEKWVVFGGLHAAQNKVSGGALRASFPVAIYPTTGFNYRINRIVTASASVSRGYSSLSFNDVLDSSGRITQGIKPETGWSEEVTISIGDIQGSFFRMGVFHMDIDNSVITVRIADDIFEKRNAGSSVHEGLEAEFRIMTNDKAFEIEGAYTIASYRFAGEQSGKSLPGTPGNKTFTRGLWRPFPSLEVYMHHHWVSDIFLDDANTWKGDGYHLVHAGAAYSWSIHQKWQINFAGHVHNVFDKHYASMFQINAPVTPSSSPRYFYPGKPRSYYGSVWALDFYSIK